MKKISNLITTGVMGVKCYSVGENGVTQIQDMCVDAEQNFVPQYDIYTDGKLRYSLVNGVYEIEYKTEN